MKPKQAQVGRQSSKGAPAAQSKSSTRARAGARGKGAKGGAEPGGITLNLQDEDGTTLDRVEFSAELSARLKRVASVLDVELSTLIQNAVFTLIAAERPGADVGAGVAAEPSGRAGRGWAESHGFTPGGHAEKPLKEFGGNAEAGYSLGVPGLPSWLRFDEERLLRYMAGAVGDGLQLLGTRVLPKLQSAYDVAEFADLLWTAQAILESGEDRFMLSTRDDLGGYLKEEILGKERFRLVRFFSDVLCERSAEIAQYALPHAGPRLAAQLAEALALAEMLSGEDAATRRAKRKRIASSATAAQRQAWEARARAWLWKDCWVYDNDHGEMGRRDPSEGGSEVETRGGLPLAGEGTAA